MCLQVPGFSLSWHLTLMPEIETHVHHNTCRSSQPALSRWQSSRQIQTKISPQTPYLQTISQHQALERQGMTNMRVVACCIYLYLAIRYHQSLIVWPKLFTIEKLMKDEDWLKIENLSYAEEWSVRYDLRWGRPINQSEASIVHPDQS